MKVIKSIFIFVLGFLSIAILFEFLLSFCGILDPVVRIDPEKGERYRPNRMCSSLFVCEGFGLSKTNSSGWFGHDFKDNGPDNISVAVIGNSFVASRQLFYRSNFLSVAERKANELLTTKTTSFFNFGKEDLPPKELLYIKDDITKTDHPDYTIILLNEGTFSIPSHRYVAQYKFEKGKFKVDTSFKETSFVKNYKFFEVLTKSSVMFLIRRVQTHLPNIWEICLDKFYIPKKEEEKKQLLTHLTDTDVNIVRELSKDKHVIFLLDLPPYLTVEIKSIIGSSHFVNIEVPLAEARRRGLKPNYWEIPDIDGHWNFIGHRIIGNEIAKKLVQIINADSSATRSHMN